MNIFWLNKVKEHFQLYFIFIQTFGANHRISEDKRDLEYLEQCPETAQLPKMEHFWIILSVFLALVSLGFSGVFTLGFVLVSML